MNIKVKQTKAENLAREYAVTVAASAVTNHINQRLGAIQKTFKMPGFRPGKVPLELVKKNYGKSVLGEALEALVRDSSAEAMKKEGVRPALKPDIKVEIFEEGKDLTYRMSLEILPEVPAVDFSKIMLQKEEKSITDKEVEETLNRLLQEHKHYHLIEKPRPAQKSDRAVIDFTGYMDGKPFEGGKAEKFPLVLGGENFIEGFEDQVIGMNIGEKKRIKVSFPKQYHKKDMAGKPVEFDVALHEIHEEHKQEKADDHFAQHMGFKNVYDLAKTIRSSLENEAKQQSRLDLKKQLFDWLDEQHDFPVPAKMVEMEYQSVWQQVQQARKANPDSEEFKGKSDKDLEKEYRRMAERRVRLGILLSEIGAKNNVQVTNEELSRAVLEQARQFPGQENRVYDFFRKNPGELEGLRGPILEEKVVDFILSKATLKTEKSQTENKKETKAEAAKPKVKKAAKKK